MRTLRNNNNKETMQEQLLNAIQQGRAPHAIIVSGPEGSGRRELARRVAALYCLGEDTPQRLTSCPNYTETGVNAVRVEDVRNLLASAAMQGFNGGNRAFVFINAQNMSVQVQNTLLKTLEEPNAGTMLILTGNEFGLLPTIRSRCVTVRLGAKRIGDVANELERDGVSGPDAFFYATLADGVPGRAKAYAAEEAQAFRKDALKLLEQAAFSYAPFKQAADLITGSFSEEGGGKKKKRGDTKLAMELLSVWTSVFRDAAMRRLGVDSERNTDADALVERISASFTTARIQGIIDLLARAQQRIAGGANVYLTVDGALTGLFIKENEETT